ncbi:MAG: pantetheine-phosphate adenylyltransferase [Actinomycetaceae bacterium]|nr:pantetheine-phosphate adenylyltransferase [Actinomycetaceae bacterium]
MRQRQLTRCAVYPGSFDPPTLGHCDIVERASVLYDELVIAVALNGAKRPFFSSQERMELWKNTVSYLATDPSCCIRVCMVEGLIAHYCQENAIPYIVKGVRNSEDMVNEMNQAFVNRQISDVDTVFLPCRTEYSHISSTIVKDIVRHGGDVSWAVPRPVNRMLQQKRHGNNEQ